MLDPHRLRAAYEKVRDELLAERTPDGHWVGELSSSALSTATAVSALAVVKSATIGRGLRVQGSGFGVQETNGVEQGASEASTQSSVLGTQYREAAGSTFDRSLLTSLIDRGVTWLVRHQNDDGGFGDTDLSRSNIATTYLVVAALHLAGVANEHGELIRRANVYIDSKGRLNGLRERYGIDKTFVVPIMTNLALAGLVDWREIDSLPFELACVPQSWYRFVGMPVVSYAIPALVAIGQARYFHALPRNPLTRLLRWLSLSRSLKVLRRMQPDSGGYLEATPLTSFVVMSLASVEGKNATADEVIREGVKFLINSIRPDGSWPIDTNLATWNTTLAINALAGAGEDVAELLGAKRRGASEKGVPTQSVGTRQDGDVLDWLLSCQRLDRHPFTGAYPGGFGWSDLSGAVPDADDTSGAIIAMCHFREELRWGRARNWLRYMQNADGGWPTFCRGWGRLPFDRSGTDLTAHAVRAFRELGGPSDQLWRGVPDGYFEQLYRKQVNRAFAYLTWKQNSDGSWSPLWFGNQDHPQEDNPVYGTAKVLMAYRDLGLMDSPEARRGVAWLVANQNEDGGWGSGVWQMRNAEFGVRNEGGAERQGSAGVELEVDREASAISTEYLVPSTQYSVLSTAASAHTSPRPQPPDPSPLPSNPKSKIQNLKSSIEETSLAVEALLAACPPNPQPPAPSPASAAVEKGLNWLIDRVEQGQHRQPAPIGFYFAKLWYYERLYPLTFTVAALGRACQQFARLEKPAQPSESRAP